MASCVVVYQGVPGDYAEAATRQLLGPKIQAVGVESFSACFKAVEEGNADYTLVPLENSASGSVYECFDLVLRFDLNIVAELDFNVCHCLVALPGTAKENIKMVISDPQALEDCEEYLKRNNLLSTKDCNTAEIAKKISDENLFCLATIGSERVATKYNLEIIEKNVGDDPNNVTRFVLLSRKCLFPPTKLSEKMSTSYKTSIAISFENAAGTLCNILSFFAENGLDLVKVESRPNKCRKKGRFLPQTLSNDVLEIFSTIPYSRMTGLGSSSPAKSALGQNYPFVFFIDFLGSISEQRTISAFKKIAKFCTFFRVLGSFPRNGILEQFVADSSRPAATSSIISTESLDSKQCKPLNLALVGFSKFAQFLATTFAERHRVVACSETDRSTVAMKLGIKLYNDAKSMLAEEDIDVVIICVPILALEDVLSKIPPELFRNKLIVDTLPVKTYPKAILLDFKKKHNINCGILLTHPMFRPENPRDSWSNVPFVYEKVLNDSTSEINSNAERFLAIFDKHGCRMVEKSSEEHDLQVAEPQFLTHFFGRSIDRIGLQSFTDSKHDASTIGFKALRALRDQTVNDSLDLLLGTYVYSKNMKSMLMKLQETMKEILLDLDLRKSSFSHGDDEFEFLPARRLSRTTFSRTQEIFGLAMKLREEGRDVMIGLCVGQPDFAPPKKILDATKRAVDEGHTGYTRIVGVEELRVSIVNDLKRRKNLEYSINNVIVCQGALQSIFLIAVALLAVGDEVIIPAPFWSNYPGVVNFTGATPVFVDRSPKNGYIMTKEQLEKAITPKTKMLIFCNPCNPTGCVYSKNQMEDLAEVLRKPENRHIVVVSDEIYERFLFDQGTHISFASLEGFKKRTLIVNGFSKAYSMTGFRLGYIASDDPQMITWCSKLTSQINSCASSISQQAGIAALDLSDEELEPLFAEMEEKRDLICTSLRKIPHLLVPPVKGVFYVFPDVSYYFGSNRRSRITGAIIETSTDLSLYLIEYFGIAMVAGDAFGAPYGLRMSFATSKAEIRAAVERLKGGLESLEII